MGNRTFRIICFWMPCGVKRWCSNLPIWQTISKSFQPLLKFPFIIFIHSLQIIKTIDWGVHCLNGNTKLHQFRLIRLLCNGNTWHTVYHPQLPLSVAARFIIIILSDCEQVCTWNVSVCLCLPITSCIASFFLGGGGIIHSKLSLFSCYLLHYVYRIHAMTTNWPQYLNFTRGVERCFSNSILLNNDSGFCTNCFSILNHS